ncbi:uncharacterized protein BJ171DRAFT_594670 [Polychytrium aggregatum]|uniref:uncharacterized protein n=1 Tax=Polychytrium aggregatum TaxID=110093 RepID=UPI0022FDB1A4|nr:uncharacterized protein BJ171DRAFT_594670 [Polychytrium aggregatum]KAI9209636.1 hypothetical protein BJ171DRAFT_594670 [Polychytrium aggregatum]
MSLLKSFIDAVPKSFRDLEWFYRVNPSLPPVIVKASEYRNVAPGSQPDFNRVDTTPISKNQYFTRDVRRSYPQTVVYTSEELSKELTSGALKSIASGEAQVTTSTASTQIYTPSHLPPIINNRYNWKKSSPHLAPNEVNPQFSIQGRA